MASRNFASLWAELYFRSCFYLFRCVDLLLSHVQMASFTRVCFALGFFLANTHHCLPLRQLRLRIIRDAMFAPLCVCSRRVPLSLAPDIYQQKKKNLNFVSSVALNRLFYSIYHFTSASRHYSSLRSPFAHTSKRLAETFYRRWLLFDSMILPLLQAKQHLLFIYLLRGLRSSDPRIHHLRNK